jgi:hypothetical protein
MKLEFLRSGAPACPLIRLYEFNAAAASQLHQIVLRLAENQMAFVTLDQEPSISPIGGCKLTLRSGKEDRGVTEAAPFRFEWVSSGDGWLGVAGLIQPFTREELCTSHQWLSSIGKIAVLFSPNGSW